MSSFTVTPTTTSVALSISANGTLQVSVKDDLDNNVTEENLFLSDSTGNTPYGTPQTIVDGAVTFANVPYDDTTPISVYVAQGASDENHNPITTPQSVSMGESPKSASVLNDRKESNVNFTAADTNYGGIAPLTGELVVNG